MDREESLQRMRRLRHRIQKAIAGQYRRVGDAGSSNREGGPRWRQPERRAVPR